MSVPIRPLPAGPAVMRQRWKDLLFLHWKWDEPQLQATLPPGLTVDTFEGNAWLGVVPFFMCGVRPSLHPPVPLLSNFLALNVRTFVRDSEGKPGVWFYSLDCNQPVAVSVVSAALRQLRVCGASFPQRETSPFFSLRSKIPDESFLPPPNAPPEV